MRRLESSSIRMAALCDALIAQIQMPPMISVSVVTLDILFGQYLVANLFGNLRAQGLGGPAKQEFVQPEQRIVLHAGQDRIPVLTLPEAREILLERKSFRNDQAGKDALTAVFCGYDVDNETHSISRRGGNL